VGGVAVVDELADTLVSGKGNRAHLAQQPSIS
jgi:hypothetical protein